MSVLRQNKQHEQIEIMANKGPSLNQNYGKKNSDCIMGRF